MQFTTEAARSWLVSRGATFIEHPGGTLFDHCCRVQQLLEGWGADISLQLAGLCHAAYGTDGFVERLLPYEDREALSDVIGPLAEEHVYLYGSCTRSFVYPHLNEDGPLFLDRFTGSVLRPSPETHRGFLELTAANELDVVRHSAVLAREYGAALSKLVLDNRRRISPRAIVSWSKFQVL